MMKEVSKALLGEFDNTTQMEISRGRYSKNDKLYNYIEIKNKERIGFAGVLVDDWIDYASNPDIEPQKFTVMIQPYGCNEPLTIKANTDHGRTLVNLVRLQALSACASEMHEHLTVGE